MITMVADSQVCRVCGGPISAERRLMPTSRGSWAVVTVPVGCRNPLCPLSTTEQRTAPPGSATLVA